VDSLRQALVAGDAETELHFSVYIGPLEANAHGALPATTSAARALHAQLPRTPHAVLLAVSPNQRALEIVTGERARVRLGDEACALVAMSATSSFAAGDLTGGLVTALRMLTDRAR
jgi:hypothetical protein